MHTVRVVLQVNEQTKRSIMTRLRSMKGRALEHTVTVTTRAHPYALE
jgi:hypothetical protein